jgi:hypothetical protein
VVRQDIASGTIPRITLPPLDTELLRQERRQRELQQGSTPAANPGAAQRTRENRRPRRLEVGIVRPVQISAADGQWLPQPDGSRLWMLDITSPGAVSVKVHFSNFMLPIGMTLHVSSPDQAAEPDEFQSRGPFDDGDFWTPLVRGDTVRLTVGHESGTDWQGDPAALFQIADVGHVYEDLRDSFSGTPAACELDAMCYPDWSGSGDSVVRILFSDATYYYACSATLVNNRSGDFSPFLLTAAHCIDSDALARTVDAYFFYTSKFCGALPGGDNQPILSPYATFLASTSIDDSDTSLIQLLNSLPTSAVWAAWTTNDPGVGESITSIHHPVAASRRIAFGTRVSDVTAGRYGVNWTQGITEHGSSGGPLFNSNHEVVGQLHGGYSTCSVSGPDSYGKLSAAYALLADNNGRKYLEQGLPDDGLANNSRDQAYSISLPTTLSGLVVKKLADDWFKVSVAANQGFGVDLPYVPNSTAWAEVYKGTQTAPIASGDRHVEAGAGDSPSDFYVRVFLPSNTPNPYFTSVRSTYDVSIYSKQVPPAGLPL